MSITPHLTKWETLNGDEKVAWVEHTRATRTQHPDPDAAAFRRYACQKHRRIQHHVKQILKLRAS